MRDRVDPEHRDFLEEVADFLRTHGPSAANADPRACLDALAGRGWLAPEWPSRWGGAGLDPQRAFLLDRALAEAGVVRPDPETLDLTGGLIRTFGTPGQQARWLPELAGGRTVSALHGSLRGGEPLLVGSQDGQRYGLEGTAHIRGAALADLILVVARSEPGDELALLVGRPDPGAVTAGLPLDPDSVSLAVVTFERLGSARIGTEFRSTLAGALGAVAGAARCRTVGLRRSVAALQGLTTLDGALARRLPGLAIELLGLEALELRAYFQAGQGPPDVGLLGIVAIRAAELGAALAGLAVAALGYQALPAPDPHRQHNELPAGTGSAPGPDAIASLLRYVGGLDVMGARDRLAHLAGSGPHEG